MNPEVSALRMNVIVAIFYAIFILVLAYFAKSLTIFLDAGYSMAALLIYLFSLYVVKKIKQPDNCHYPYGHYKLEPVFILIQSSFVSLLAVTIVVISALDLVFNSMMANYGFALFAALLSTVVCLVMYFYIKRAATLTGSKILEADSQLWKSDTILSVGVLVGILIGFVLEKTRFYGVAHYVDPIVAISLSCVLIVKPAKLVSKTFKQLLDSAPSDKYVDVVTASVNSIAQQQSIVVDDIKMTEAGRFIFIDIRPDSGSSPSIENVKQLKTCAQAECAKLLEDYTVEVVVSF